MNASISEFCKELERAKDSVKDKEGLEKTKLKIGNKLGLKELPSNPEILMHMNPDSKLAALLRIKPLRTLSGVAPVAVMTKPIKCPHGTCIYCPGGPGSVFGDVPQSYTGREPATMRGIAHNYDSYKQAMNRLSQYYVTGHNPEKIEIIVMGGTFPSFPDSYQEEFITGCFKAANDFSEKFFENGEFKMKKLTIEMEKWNAENKATEQGKSESEKGNSNKAGKNLIRKTEQGKTESLIRKTEQGKTNFENSDSADAEQSKDSKRSTDYATEHKKNETAKVRIVTLGIETKPDWCQEKEINKMLELGATRVELGCQSVYNEVLKFTNRGHTIDETIKATQMLKDSGLKVTYHMMPGQPLSTKEKDIDMFRELFENPSFKPDALKIYPCMVMPGTALEKLYEKGKYEPLGTEEAAEIISEAYRYIPEYVRVHRIQRDIPTKHSKGGVDKNNLRQIVEKKMKEKGIEEKDIRARESGIKASAGKDIDYSKVKLTERFYEASGGEEAFISFEDSENKIIAGFCRLRKPNAPFRKEFTADSTCIRELHVFGTQLNLGSTNPESQQHRGFGKKLMERAEEIAKEKFDAKKMLVISGVGAREYYKNKLGYERDGIYMAKKL